MVESALPMVQAAILGNPHLAISSDWVRRSRSCSAPGIASERRRHGRVRRLAKNATAEKPVLYGDEVDLHFNPKIGRGWMLPGHRRFVVTPGKNKKQYVAGALNAKTRQLTWADGSSKSSDLFCKLAWRLLFEYPKAKCIHLVVDSYIIYTSKRTQRFWPSSAGE